MTANHKIDKMALNLYRSCVTRLLWGSCGHKTYGAAVAMKTWPCDIRDQVVKIITSRQNNCSQQEWVCRGN